MGTEAGQGFDGTWVAHPDLVAVAHRELDAVLDQRPNQKEVLREDVTVTASDLLDVAATPGDITEAGLRNDVSVGVQYIACWLRGTGATAINKLMEDAATAEIARSQVWQWIRHGSRLSDGRVIDRFLVSRVIDEEAGRVGLAGEDAVNVFRRLVAADELAEFLTLEA